MGQDVGQDFLRERGTRFSLGNLERATGFEPATLGLGSRCATVTPHPLGKKIAGIKEAEKNLPLFLPLVNNSQIAFTRQRLMNETGRKVSGVRSVVPARCAINNLGMIDRFTSCWS